MDLHALTQLRCESGGESQCVLTLIMASAVPLFVLFTRPCILLRQSLEMVNVSSCSVFIRRGWVLDASISITNQFLCVQS